MVMEGIVEGHFHPVPLDGEAAGIDFLQGVPVHQGIDGGIAHLAHIDVELCGAPADFTFIGIERHAVDELVLHALHIAFRNDELAFAVSVAPAAIDGNDIACFSYACI